MVEVPESLECLFSASLDRDGSTYRIEIPKDELEIGPISADETYRVAVLENFHSNEDTGPQRSPSSVPEQPVSKGDVREVRVESLGDQGDGIAKVGRGYVVVVPGGRPDDEVTVEIQQARENVAFAKILPERDGEPTS